MTRRDGEACGLELLGTGPGGLYVRAAGGNRRALLGSGRAVRPFVAADPTTGRPRRRREDRTRLDGEVVLVGEHLVLALPEPAAVALPRA
ncbi:hypothetical protein AB0B01_18555 [Streptomyces sp. NPDC044571]|uniref:hypothetical protein n=1 Tax=Streptomyces sp. NPDC044571 TaxID=3155371 RepID=UPI003401487B